MIRGAGWTLAMSFALTACAGPAAGRRTAATSPVTSEEAAAILDAVVAKEHDGKLAAALRDARDLAARPGFDAIDPGLRRAALFDVGLLSLKLGDAAAAQPFLQRSSAMAEASAIDAKVRMEASLGVRDWADVIASLTLLARRWPAEVVGLDEELVFRALGLAEERASSDESFLDLAEALFAAGWESKRFPEPSWAWKELAGRLVERGDLQRASEVAARVTAPSDVAAMRMDRRFDPIVRSSPGRFDVSRARAREVERYRARVRAEPRSMIALSLLARSLLESHAYAEVLRVTEAPVAALEAGGEVPWDDADEMGPELMDVRSRALRAQGRWEEAVELLSRATARRPGGHFNVDQTINLASFLCALDRPRDARATLDRLPEGDTSPFGRMLLERVRALAAARLGDEGGVERSLAYLREHRGVSFEALQDTLVSLGRADEAAALFVSRLEDPKLRSEALAEAQEHEDGARTPLETEWTLRWRAMIARPDVQVAIAKVGRIEVEL